MAKKQRRRAKPRVGLEQIVAALDAVERALKDIRTAVTGLPSTASFKLEADAALGDWPGESCLAAWPGTACRTEWPGESCGKMSAPALACIPAPSIACFSPWPGESCAVPLPGAACRSWPGESCRPPVPSMGEQVQKPRAAKKRTKR